MCVAVRGLRLSQSAHWPPEISVGLGTKIASENISNECFLSDKRYLFCNTVFVSCLLYREMGSACGTYERRITINRILVGGSEGRRPLGRRRSRWEDKKVDLQEIGWEGVEWIDLADGGK